MRAAIVGLTALVLTACTSGYTRNLYEGQPPACEEAPHATIYLVNNSSVDVKVTFAPGGSSRRVNALSQERMVVPSGAVRTGNFLLHVRQVTGLDTHGPVYVPGSAPLCNEGTLLIDPAGPRQSHFFGADVR